ncbi:PREDICTED: protein-lysine N-methyltransferase EEF2KMT [Thamnophis sirtalis]|uniref:Protein-lysine N-methyltransferase EEF2KMT n=1 Tax=Thamnophis sirtalis TaxID=35019 RepID=A0A6I9YEY8_9SAUR|nr:PREDICTED: protein-lysine N-methyltransferase EEF2KMT [Thamnophis sirtalis]
MKTQNILALILSLLAGVVCYPAVQKEKTTGAHKLLLISFDGFRWNYDEDVDTPHMDYLAKEGVKAKYITPPFVTMTSPSHFTMITGLFPLSVSKGDGSFLPICSFQPSGDAVTLRENVAFVSQGTTGLVTWDAGLYLAEWALENSEVFRNRRILELGSGTGLTGIAICKAFRPREYIFSDHHEGVLQQLSENIHLNGLTLEAESCSHCTGESPNHQGHPDVDSEDDHVQISVKELDWNLVSKDELAKLQADVILAADVVYDPEVSQHLIGVLQKFPRDGGPEVYIAFNIRNPDTYHDFQMQLDKVEIGREVVAASWKNLFPYDQHANIVILRLYI